MAASVAQISTPVVYPDSDGLPMAESDFQCKPLTYAVDALGLHFQAQPQTYRLWQEAKAPDFILEITSESTWRKDVEDNPRLYARLGVQEYFQYDPTGQCLASPLQGQRLVGQRYEPLRPDPR